MDLLNIENIRISYGKELIIDDISFKINPGEFTSLLGLNGAGKTTLIKAISGILKPVSGTIKVQGKDISQLKPKERARHISFMPQRHSIVYDTTVLDVVLMGITPYIGILDYPTKSHRRLAYDILKKLKMEELSDENFLHLSEGQKQLIIIARSIIQDSEIMLFDEPDSALDFNNKHMVISKIGEIVKTENRAGIITLHDPNTALDYCDRIIIIKDKKAFADFYINNVDIDFLRKTFSQIYGKINIIEYKGSYMLVKDNIQNY